MNEVICPHCMNTVDETDTTCPACGEAIEPVVTRYDSLDEME